MRPLLLLFLAKLQAAWLASGLDETEPRRLVHYAAMAYCSDKAVYRKTCGPCRGIDSGVAFRGIYESHLDAHALILLDHRRGEIIAAFRGLVTWKNFKKSLDMNRYNLQTHAYQNTSEAAHASAARVHRGFKLTADSLVDYVNPELKVLLAEYPDYRLQLVGHSMGGAIATLMTVQIHQQLKVPLARMRLTTYGQPRVGNRVFAEWFNALPIAVARVVNEDDAIPHLPGNWNGFYHTKGELYIKGDITAACPPADGMLESPLCSNSRVPELGYASHLQAWGIPLTKEAC